MTYFHPNLHNSLPWAPSKFQHRPSIAVKIVLSTRAVAVSSRKVSAVIFLTDKNLVLNFQWHFRHLLQFCAFFDSKYQRNVTSEYHKLLVEHFSSWEYFWQFWLNWWTSSKFVFSKLSSGPSLSVKFIEKTRTCRKTRFTVLYYLMSACAPRKARSHICGCRAAASFSKLEI